MNTKCVTKYSVVAKSCHSVLLDVFSVYNFLCQTASTQHILYRNAIHIIDSVVKISISLALIVTVLLPIANKSGYIPVQYAC